MKNKLIALSLVIILSILGFLYWNSLQDQTKLPSEKWSRTYPIHTVVSNFSKLQSIADDNGYTISLTDFNKLEVLDCDAELSCKQNRTIDNLNTYKNSWSNKMDSYFIRENNLIHLNKSAGETTIATDVANFTMNENKLVYWTEENDIFVINTLSSNENQQFSTVDPIYYANIIDDEIFIMTKSKQDIIEVYSLNEGLTQLFTFQAPSQELLLSIDIFETKDNNFTMILDKKIISGGGSTKKIELVPFDLTAKGAPTFTIPIFEDRLTGINLKDINNPKVYQGEQGPIITFSATMYDPLEGQTNKIYVGEIKDGNIQADPATKAGTRYERSILLNEETIAYLRMKGKERHLEYASAEPQKVQESSGIMPGDYKAALYSLLGKLFNGFLLVLFAFVWIILSFMITYGASYLLNRMNYKHAYPTAFIIHLVALFGLQTYFLYSFTNIESIIYNVPFVSNIWQFTIFMIIAILVSIVPLLLLRQKVSEENFNVFTLYSMFMNLAILFLLVGPYIF